MTTIHVAIDRLILHGSPEGLSPDISRDLGALVTARLEELAAGAQPHETGSHLTESHRIAAQVASEVWRNVTQHREGLR